MYLGYSMMPDLNTLPATCLLSAASFKVIASAMPCYVSLGWTSDQHCWQQLPGCQ